MQTSIPCSVIRGGTSKGLFFLATDLPADESTRDRVLVAALGEDERQIDGIGGADPLTSKVAIVGRSSRADADIDYLFVQVVVGEGRVDTTPNCGNTLAGTGPFAIERGLFAVQGELTTVRVHMVNSGNLCELIVQTPGGAVEYEGDTAISGVPGTAAPIICNYLDVAGSICGSLYPTGHALDRIAGVDVTCVDNGMPVVVARAADFGISGYESREELNSNAGLKEQVDRVRLAAGPRMNLGDVSKKVVPKLTLIAPPRSGGNVCSRTFIPRECHAAIGVLGAVSVATACITPGSVAEGIALVPPGATKRFSVEHPSGEFTVELDVGGTDAHPEILRAGLIRTARLIMSGEILIPSSVWRGK